MVRPRGPKPAKPRPDFPLFAHASGTWAKTIKGSHKHFGPWGDPKGAEAAYLEFASAQRAGRNARPRSDGSITLKELSNRFLTNHLHRLAAGEITDRSFSNFADSVERFTKHVGSGVMVMDMAPEQFAAYRAKLLDGFGYHAANRNIGIVRQMFKWAFENEFLDRPVNFGTGFKKLGRAVERKQRKRREFTPDEIRRFYDGSPPGSLIRAAVLLGVNGGFGNTDLSALREDEVDLAAGIIDLHRHKTGIRRRCLLWPETIDAMRQFLEQRPRARVPEDVGLFFLTNRGRRLVRHSRVTERGILKGVTVTDGLNSVFRKLMVDVGLWKLSKKGNPISDGRGFYTFRRTHRTWADEVHDDRAADVLMGHATDGTVAGVYVQDVSDARLRAIVEHLRSKVWPAT